MKRYIERMIKTNNVLNRLFTLIGSIPLKIMGLFIREKKKSILFVSYMGKSFNDSPKDIFKEVLSDDTFKGYTFVWAFKDINNFQCNDPRVRFVKIDSLSYFITALSSSFWITNVNIERGLKFKKKYTTYVNTWHGIPIKKIGNDVEGRNDFDFSNIDYFSYSGDFEKKIYKRAFQTSDINMYSNGMPRNDVLINNNLTFRDKIRELYNLGDKKVILYAPTWRDTESDIPKLSLKKWENTLGGEYVLLIRSHGLSESYQLEDSNFVIDVSNYDETSELLTVVDILISDYSSIIFDFSLTSRPILLYIPDYDKYMKERGVYFDLKKSGLTVFDKEVELINYIKEIDYFDEKYKVEEFRDKYFYESDGQATKKVVQFLKERVK